MHASAAVVAAADGRGGTRLAVLRGEAPLLLRRTNGGGRAAEVHLVGGAAGPIGGDRLRLEIEVGVGAALCLRTVAASIALPGVNGGESRFDVVARVARGGRLSWLPEPLIAAADCRHLAVVTVDVAEGGWLCWRDEVVCGRHGERPGDVRTRTTVRYAGRTLYRQDLTIGPAAPGWDGPAVLGSTRASGSVLVVDPAWADGGSDGISRGGRTGSNGSAGRVPTAAVLGPGAALTPLAGPAILATAAAADPREVRAWLDPVTPRPDDERDQGRTLIRSAAS
jgi:urease accessory protein